MLMSALDLDEERMDGLKTRSKVLISVVKMTKKQQIFT
jgi:hypothetical protein